MVRNTNSNPSDGVFKKIVREVVKEEITPVLEEFKIDILHAVDQKNDKVVNEITIMKDEIVGEIKDMREDHEIVKGRHAQILAHDDRIEKLEKIHPQGHHATV